jgi:transcriptional regulator with XRE-family HTH domain
MQHYDHEEFRQALAARIKALRKAKGWTQMRMTTDFGYHLAFWQNVENGRKMSLQTMLRVANTFDMTIDELLQGIKRRKGPGFGSKGYYQREPPSKDS